MAKRSNAIPTFNPSSKEVPPENGFQPASLISSSQMNGLNYISYNFTNSFINALINHSGLTDDKVYAYTDTDWATKIGEDLKGVIWSTISKNPTFSSITIGELGTSLTESAISLTSKEANYYHNIIVNSKALYAEKRNSNLNEIFSFKLEPENTSIEYTNYTYSTFKNTIQLLPDGIKEENITVTNVLAKTFTYNSKPSLSGSSSDIIHFLNAHDNLNILGINLKRETSSSMSTMNNFAITARRKSSINYLYNFYYLDAGGVTQVTEDLGTLYTAGTMSITIYFC